MDTLSLLQNRYETAMQSGTEWLFYRNVHDYLDLIHKTPAWAQILENSESEYSSKHKAIWAIKTRDDKELDIRENETILLERGSLYAANFALLAERIYWPIEEQRKLNSQWLDGKRSSYEGRLRQFHSDFLTELHKNEPVISRGATLPFSFNIRTGDFKLGGVQGVFSPASQEYKVLCTIWEDKDHQASYLSLLQAYMPSVEHAGKVYKDQLRIVIRNIKERFGILPKSKAKNSDIFKAIRGFGYRLDLSHKKVKSE